jgi:hypothetical protein
MSDSFTLEDCRKAVKTLREANVPDFRGHYFMNVRTGLLEQIDDPYVRMLARRRRYGGRKGRSAQRRLIRWFAARGIVLVCLP